MGSVKTWEDAESVCQSQTWGGVQGHLASVHSEEENIFVASLAIEGLWLGLNDLHKEGQWSWTDGTSLGYSNWARGEPNNVGNNEHCMELPKSTDKQWNDGGCTSQRRFVCKLTKGNNNYLITYMPLTTTSAITNNSASYPTCIFKTIY